MSPDPPLSPRQEALLLRVVEAYIEAGVPIGSRTLVEQGAIVASPSTVRHELSELEGLGMLGHPHTSAGRVPTTEGYRYYTALLERRGVEARPLPGRPERCARRARFGPAADGRGAGAGHGPAGGRLGSVAGHDRRAARRAGAAAAAARHGGRDHGLRRCRQAPLRLRAGRRRGTAGVGARLHQRVDRRSPPGRAHAARSASPTPRWERPSAASWSAWSPVFTQLVDEGSLYLGGAAGLLADLRDGELASLREVVSALEERLQLLAALRDVLDSDRGWIRVGDDTVAPGPALALPGGRQLRHRKPQPRHGGPDRPPAHGLRGRDARSPRRSPGPLRVRGGDLRLT